MKSPRKRWRMTLLVLAVAPSLLWAALVMAFPTDWARGRIAARLSDATGTPVDVAGVRLGFLGGLSLQGLSLGGDDPWLRVDHALVDLGILRMLVGNGELTELAVEGFDLRVHRREDGTFEFGDPLAPGPAPRSDALMRDDEEPADCGLQLHVRDGRVRILDDPSGTSLEVRNVRGHATWQDGIAQLHRLNGDLNGGSLAIAACLDRSSPLVRVSGQMKVEEVGLNRKTDALSMLVPIRSGRSEGFTGQADLDLQLEAHGTSKAQLRSSLRGGGTVRVDPVRLDGTGLWSDLADVLGLPRTAKVGSARSDFRIGQGRVSTDNLTLDVAGRSVVLTGSTDFDGRIDYTLRPEGLVGRLPREAREFLDEASGELSEMLTVRVVGTLDAPEILGDPGRPEDREKLKQIGRKLRDRLLR